MRAALTTLIAGSLAVTLDASAPTPKNPMTHIRPMQSAGEALVDIGMRGSPTFRRLVNRLERSDVFVYIDVRPDMPDHLGGALRFVTRSATARFLRIQLNRALSQPMQVALLGHELQHAVEVADAPGIGSADGMRTLYRRVGVATGPDTYDSIAARQAGYTVRDELLGRQGDDVRLALADAHAPASSRWRAGAELPAELLAPAVGDIEAHDRH